jgi:hypothetical protein
MQRSLHTLASGAAALLYANLYDRNPEPAALAAMLRAIDADILITSETTARVVARAAEVTGTQILGGYRVTWKGRYRTPLGALPEPWGHQTDQILLSAGIGIVSVETLDLPGSDHLGLLLRLRIPAR